MSRLRAQLRREMLVLSGIACGMLLAAFAFTVLLQRWLSAPLLNLTELVRRITATQNYALRQALLNLVANAFKFTRKQAVSEVEIGMLGGQGGEDVYFVKDNGAGFDMRFADRLFRIFQRMHSLGERTERGGA